LYAAVVVMLTACAQASLTVPHDTLDQQEAMTTLMPPPRTVDDILAVLDQYKPDPGKAAQNQAQAHAQPPASTDPRTLAAFYHRRGRAARLIGDQRQAIADFRKALEYAQDDIVAQEEGIGTKRWILDNLAHAERVGGNYRAAIRAREAQGRLA
jgi:hypothetical protein